MTLRWIFVSFLLYLAANVSAQSSPAADQTVASQRAGIAVQREKVQAEHAIKEAACYKLFAVNDCLNRARVERREALADLQRQDNSLNDLERRRKSGQKIQSIDDKLMQDRLAIDAAARARPPAAPSSAPVVDSAAARREHESRLARQKSEDAHRAEQAAQAPSKRQQYEERLRKAQERRAEHEQKLLKAKQDAASAPKGLPVPP